MTIDQLTDPAPHTCPECGEPSYLGFFVPARCTNRLCVFFDQDLWVEHVMALPDEEVGQEFDIEEDEDTIPGQYPMRFTKVTSWMPMRGLPAVPSLLPLDKLTYQELWDRTIQLEHQLKGATTGAAIRDIGDLLTEVDKERVRRKLGLDNA